MLLGNAGLVVASHSIPLAAPGVWQQGLAWMLRRDAPFHLRPRLDVDLVRWLWRFLRSCTDEHVASALPLLKSMSFASLRLWDQLAALPGLDFAYRQDGMLMAYRTAEAFAAAGHEAGVAPRARDRRRGPRTGGDGRAEPGLGGTVAGSVLFSDDAQMIPDLFVKGLARQASNVGVKVVTSAQVVRFETAAGTIKAVQTTAGVFAADEFVLAAGVALPRSCARPRH